MQYSRNDQTLGKLTIENCYYLEAAYPSSAAREGVTEKTPDAFASGEVTWLLNGKSSENVAWKQTLGNDPYPNFTDEVFTQSDVESDATLLDDRVAGRINGGRDLAHRGAGRNVVEHDVVGGNLAKDYAVAFNIVSGEAVPCRVGSQGESRPWVGLGFWLG